jgi:DNA repair exonuclease SbcCD ATPase subunit
MCKKLIKTTLFGGGALLLAGFLIFGKDFHSYAKTAFHDVQSAVKDGVSVDFELRRAKELIQQIEPQILEARREVARAEVELDGLKKEIRGLEDNLDKGQGKIGRLRQMLSESGVENGSAGRLRTVSNVRGHGAFRYEISRLQVERELARTFDLFRSQKELMESKSKLILRQSQILEAARTKLVAVRGEKQRLEDLTTQLEARKRQLDALAASNQQYEFDDSALSKAKAVLDDIKKRLDVKERMIQEGIFFETGVIGTAVEEETRDITSEVDEYFSAKEGVGDAASKALQTADKGR